MKLVTLAYEAAEELAEAAGWYESRQNGLAARFLEEFEQCLVWIGTRPLHFLGCSTRLLNSISAEPCYPDSPMAWSLSNSPTKSALSPSPTRNDSPAIGSIAYGLRFIDGNLLARCLCKRAQSLLVQILNHHAGCFAIHSYDEGDAAQADFAFTGSVIVERITVIADTPTSWVLGASSACRPGQRFQASRKNRSRRRRSAVPASERRVVWHSRWNCALPAPPAGDWASGWRWYLATHLPSSHTWPRVRFGLAKKSDRRELVAVMPNRLYSRSSERFSQDFPAARAAATAPSVWPKLVEAYCERKLFLAGINRRRRKTSARL